MRGECGCVFSRMRSVFAERGDAETLACLYCVFCCCLFSQSAERCLARAWSSHKKKVLCSRALRNMRTRVVVFQNAAALREREGLPVF